MFPLIILGIIVVAVVTVAVFRYATRSLDTKELVTEGIRLLEGGLEIPRYFWLGKRLISYRDVETIELMPWYKVALQVPLLRYGIAVNSISTRLFHDTVAIKLKGPGVSETVLVTPEDAGSFMEQLKRRVQESKLPSDNK